MRRTERQVMSKHQSYKPGQVIRKGTAAELASFENGYAGTGASQYSRRVSTHANKEDLVTNVDREPRLLTMLRKHKRELAKYEAKLNAASDPKERERLQRHIGIKQAFLERLRLNRCAELG